MNAKFEMSKADLEAAIKEYFASRGVTEIRNIYFNTQPTRDAFDRAMGTYTTSATVEVGLIPERFQI